MKDVQPVRRLICFGLLHPAISATVEHLQFVATALASTPIHLQHTSRAEAWRGEPGDRAIYLRLDGLDALELGACWLASGTILLREVRRRVEELEQAHHPLPTLSIEIALQSSIAVAGFLATQLSLPLTRDAIIAAEQGHTAFVRTCAPLLQPSTFLEVIEPATQTIPVAAGDGPANRLTALVIDRPGSSILVVVGEHDAELRQVISDLGDRATTLTLSAAGELPTPLDPARPWDVIWLNRVEEQSNLPVLFAWAWRQLTPTGILAGVERSQSAAIRTLAGLTAGTEANDHIFYRIDECRWEATTPSPQPV